jgi:hypothetical protein
MLASRDNQLAVTEEGFAVVGSGVEPSKLEAKSGFAPTPSAAGYIRIAVPYGEKKRQFDPRYMTLVDAGQGPETPLSAPVP